MIVKIEDVLQIASLASVAAALVFSARQTRIAALQSREATRQTALTTVAVNQAMSVEMSRHRVDFTFSSLVADEKLTAWFLSSRGFSKRDPETNRILLLLYTKLDIHQSLFMQHSNGLITEDVWGDWEVTMRLDFMCAEFEVVWEIGRKWFTPDFVAYVDVVRRRVVAPPVSTAAVATVRAAEVQQYSDLSIHESQAASWQRM